MSYPHFDSMLKKLLYDLFNSVICYIKLCGANKIVFQTEVAGYLIISIPSKLRMHFNGGKEKTIFVGSDDHFNNNNARSLEFNIETYVASA